MNEGLGLFEGFGVELEYMLVDRESLAVMPITDQILHSVCGAYESEVEVGPLAWSNELVLHVIEIKTNGPAPTLDGLAGLFQEHVGRINHIAAGLGARLMPTAMHPWMDPHTETRLWPHEFSPVYEAFDRVFGCQGHGWSNLQSTHLNLPFADDEEFGPLHAAIRLVLPILPGLAAASPVHDGRDAGLADARLEAYRHNARRVPSVSGLVIPEPVFTKRDYEALLQGLYRDMAPFDPGKVLQHEWLNARGAIARFDRNTIEIRLLDIQECPQADLAVLGLVVATLKALVAERWSGFAEQCRWPADRLAAILHDAIRDGDGAVIEDSDYLRALGFPAAARCTIAALWRHLYGQAMAHDDALAAHEAALAVILNEGCLSRRIRAALSGDVSRDRLTSVYRRLCDCLHSGAMFRVGAD